MYSTPEIWGLITGLGFWWFVLYALLGNFRSNLHRIIMFIVSYLIFTLLTLAFVLWVAANM